MRWRPVASGVLTLVVLQVFLSGRGPEAGGQLLGWVNTGLQKALSPKVAAIPYVKPPASAKPSTPKKDEWKEGPIGLGTNPPVTGGSSQPVYT